MRIGINLLPLANDMPAQSKDTVLNIVKGIIADDRRNEYIVYVPYDISVGAELKNTIRLRLASTQIEERAKAGEIDLLFCPFLEDGMENSCCPITGIVLENYHVPVMRNITFGQWDKYYVWARVARSSQNLFVSNIKTKELAIRIFGIPENRITSIDLNDTGEMSSATTSKLIATFDAAVVGLKSSSSWSWRDIDGDSETNQPLVSVITPSFQHGQYLGRTLDSILGQDYPHVEAIVVDGGSTDETLEVLESYGERVKWVSEPDHGQTDALCKGLTMSHGRIIGWVNSDDVLQPGAISTAVEELTENPGYMSIYGEGLYIDKNDKVIGRHLTETYSTENLLHHCICCQPSVFFVRNLMEIGGLPDIKYQMAMDYELWLRYSKLTNFKYIPKYLSASRMYSENKTSRYKLKSILESMKACRKYYHRSSLSWCKQLAIAISRRVPFLQYFRITRYPIIGLVLIFLILIDLVPYYIANRVKRMYLGIWAG